MTATVQLPSGVVTFLLSDVVGSTALWEAAPTAMPHALRRHDELIAAAVGGHTGVLLKARGEGDSTFSVFQRATDAAAAALEAQGALDAADWPAGAALQVRMAVHSGEVLERDGDYYGRAVNRVARLRGIAEGAEILLSRAAADLVIDHLGPETELVELGRAELRDLDRHETIYVLRRRSAADGARSSSDGQAARLSSRDALPPRPEGNLPKGTTSFVGRERETQRIFEALESAPLVTLTGVGGVGKTRLAIHAARELASGFADGAWLCELAAADAPEVLGQVVAATLGIPNPAGADLLEAVVEFLRAKHLLLVLDNCEHLLSTSGDLAEALISSCPEVQILATSREGLGLDGERVLPLRSLDVPHPAADAELIAGTAAVRLFLERARAVGADLEDGTLTTVAEICRRLDGVPLAIELAAARAAALSPVDIAAHLDERFRLLSGGRRSAVERHQTLRAAVDWSYGLLDEWDRRVFDRLGVFAGSFDLDAAEAVVVDASGAEAFDVVDALTSLVGKSMVAADRSTGGTARYQLLETMRQYARDRLDESGGADEWRRRHAEHYALLAERASPHLRGPDEIEWNDKIGEELDNLRAAVTWALDRDEARDVQLGLRIITALASHGVSRRSSGINAWSHRALPRREHMTPVQLFEVRGGVAWDLAQSGEIAAARDLARAAVADAPEGANHSAGAYSALGTSSAMMGDLAEARAAFAAGREAAEKQADNRFSIAVLLAAEAMILAGYGETKEAQVCAQEALRLARDLRSSTVLVMASFAVGWAFMFEDSPAARAALEECIALSNAGAVEGTVGAALARVAPLRLRDGEVAGAIDALATGVARMRQLGDRVTLGTVVDSTVGVFDDLRAPHAAAMACALIERLDFMLVRGNIGAVEPGRREAVLERLRIEEPQVCEAAVRKAAQMSDEELLDHLLEELDRLRGELARPERVGQ